jgi:outer membrane protein
MRDSIIKRRVASIVGLLVLLGQAGVAQTPAPPPLTLHDCLVQAMANQADVLVAAQATTAAQARHTQARSSYYPQVALDATRDLLKSNSLRASNDPSLTITQNFYDGGLREARVARASSDIDQTAASLLRTRQTVTFTVTRAYFEALRAKHLAEVAGKRVAYIVGQRDLVKERIAAGQAAEVDAWPLEAQLANARVDGLTANNAVRTALVQVQRSIGLTPTAVFAIQDTAVAPPASVPTEEACLIKALAHRPELRQTGAAVASAQAAVKTAKINRGPRPVISGQLGQPITGGDSTNYSISGGLVLDLFNGSSTKAAYQEAAATLASTQVRAGQVPKDITAEVQEAHLKLDNARERITASAVGVTAAQRNFTAQQERYAQGLAIPLDLLNAQLEVTTAQSNAVQAQYDYLTALAQLHYAMGNEGEVAWE